MLKQYKVERNKLINWKKWSIKAIISLQCRDIPSTCKACGGCKALPCNACDGSKKSIYRNHFTAEFISLKCMNCDELGLVKCYNCTWYTFIIKQSFRKFSNSAEDWEEESNNVL
jgi:hypothetical protein